MSPVHSPERTSLGTKMGSRCSPAEILQCLPHVLRIQSRLLTLTRSSVVRPCPPATSPRPLLPFACRAPAEVPPLSPLETLRSSSLPQGLCTFTFLFLGPPSGCSLQTWLLCVLWSQLKCLVAFLFRGEKVYHFRS